MNKLTKLALDWHADGLTDKQVVDNVASELIYDLLDEYGIELSDRQEPKLEMLMTTIVTENIDWSVLEAADMEARDYRDAKRSALYK